MKENLHVYTRAFGVDIVFTLSDGTTLDKDTEGQTLKGIFDNAYFLNEIGDMDLDNTQPRLTCVSEDVAKVGKQDTVTIYGVTYEVTKKPQQDGTGMCQIPLGQYGVL